MYKLLTDNLSKLNNSKFFAGIVMIMLNIGSKYITIELSETQKQLLGGGIARQLLLFSIAWMGTHDIYHSFVLTAVFILLTDYLFNEKSKLCILPENIKKFEKALDLNKDGNVSEEEVEHALSILQKANKEKREKSKQTAYEQFKENRF